MTRSSPASPRPVGSRPDFPGAAIGDPAAFLGAFRGEPRGFWGRGERWVAWGGALARIEVDGEGGAGSSGAGDPRSSRFGVVREEARHALGRLGESVAFPWRSPRFFGGFSFVEGRSGDPWWTGFPSASFLLPRAVLASRDGDVRFTIADAEPEVVPDPDRDGPAGRGGADRERWREAVEAVLAAIGEGRLRKAVLARVLDVSLDPPVDPLAALAFLRAHNARAHVFLFEPRPGRVFLGAAPEILAQLRGGRFEATAVAGSMPRAHESSEDDELARRLLESAKNLDEHRVTVEEMVEVLQGRLVGMEVDSQPRILRLAGIQHLETLIRGSAAAGEDILSLVEAVHPTPAVCGRPRGVALDLLTRQEPFHRGWYAGPVGWFDADGEGDFVPALRSAVGTGPAWRLFAGAGIVAGSDPDAEWEETELKLEPAFRALRAGAR